MASTKQRKSVPATTPKTTSSEDRRAFVRRALHKFLDELDKSVYLVKDAYGIGLMAVALREFASELDGFSSDNFNDGYEMRCTGYEPLEELLGIHMLASDTRDQRSFELAEAQESKRGRDFDMTTAISGFDFAFNKWLLGVAESERVNTPIRAALLCRAIRSHASQFIAESTGMQPKDASDHLQTIIDGEIDADKGDAVYSVLGIEDPDR